MARTTEYVIQHVAVCIVNVVCRTVVMLKQEYINHYAIGG